ncbi:MAG: ubiquinol-cytochrome c reductase iron-sulfur subunit [Gemmataceae bacterium]|nr:ubiquinol-cytochrome c reductase iron-sulfur subunit [Gemmataceae bacterium]MDW8266258.1 ubiquinol-cytochrome c reductase iron-sulfur subunit [Gemmataceae bacterium]
MSEPIQAPESSAPPAPAKSVVPPKPTPPAKPPAKAAQERRNILVAMFATWFGIAWVTLTASLVGMVLGTIRFLFPNVLSEPPSKFKVGFPDQFEEGKVVERFKDQGAWIVRYNGIIYALSTTCTHLGCTPNWLEREGKFKCPCHGSGFKITGVNFEGPAPRPLERWGISIAEDGLVVVDKSMKFQKELGQWEMAESYIRV